MNISYNWLRELYGTRLAPRELAERLTMVGLAVDAVREAGEDFVFEFDITSNRPDCLSHLGVAREAAAVEGERVRLPEVRPARLEGRTADFASVEIEDSALCRRYTARVVRGVKIGPSPAWLAERLQAIGQRPINNVADITNYVLHELGQPLHAFDLATLAERRIVVRRARAGERLRTLDGVERELNEEMLVIADAARAVALAGVMGGEETEVTDATRDVLIESAYFDPVSVRRTAQALSMSTEASYRFERGVDYEGVVRAQERAAALICELADGTATEDVIDVYPQRLAPPAVRLRFERVKGLTGLDVPPQEALKILTALGFDRLDGGGNGASGKPAALPQSGQSASFLVPTWRSDVELEEDLVEEVARLTGYEKIDEELPVWGGSGEYRPGDRRRRATLQALAGLGFDEAINYSFINAEHEGRFELLPELLKGSADGEGKDAGANLAGVSATPEGGSEATAGKHLVSLSNPIIEGVTLMRPTLLPGLLEAVRHNFNHGTRSVRLCELGRVFAASTSGELPVERESLAFVMTGGAVEAGRAGAGRELDFYDLKGALEAAADAMNIGALEFAAASVGHLREGQAARASVGGRAIGTLGRLGEELAASYKFRQPVYVAEVDFSTLLETKEPPVLYRPLARHPSVVRDISLLIDRRTTFAELKRAVLDLGLEFCRGVELVDVFEGASLPEGKRSVTLRVEYRADERTLRDEEVDELHAGVIGTLTGNFGAQQR